MITIVPPAQKNKSSIEEFQKTPEGGSYQLINGFLEEMPSPEIKHQQVVQNLLVLITLFLRSSALGKIVVAPMDVYLTLEDVFQPDLLFISNERKDIIKERIYGAPDLTIEVLSESTAKFDYVRKKKIYAQEGVKEYWIVDIESKLIEIYQNTPDKEFTLAQIFKEGRELQSKVLTDFKPSVSEIFI